MRVLMIGLRYLYDSIRASVADRVCAASVIAVGITIDNVVHRHFPWRRFRARHTAAVGQDGKCQFSASTTESDDEPIMCDMGF